MKKKKSQGPGVSMGDAGRRVGTSWAFECWDVVLWVRRVEPI